jgi:hypothetical protein
MEAPKIDGVPKPECRLPELKVLKNGGVCWVTMIPELPYGGTAKMSRSRYEELKSWPDSPDFKDWVRTHKPEERPMKFIMFTYYRRLREIAEANNFDGHGAAETTLAAQTEQVSDAAETALAEKQTDLIPYMSEQVSGAQASDAMIIVPDAQVKPGFSKVYNLQSTTDFIYFNRENLHIEYKGKKYEHAFENHTGVRVTSLEKNTELTPHHFMLIGDELMVSFIIRAPGAYDCKEISYIWLHNKWQDHLFAFLMGRHSRLARRLEHASHVYSLPNGICEIIADQLTPVYGVPTDAGECIGKFLW